MIKFPPTRESMARYQPSADRAHSWLERRIHIRRRRTANLPELKKVQNK